MTITIIGGGPSGLSAAIALSQIGLHSTVIDRSCPPIDKACGEGLMPDGIESLARLGITIPVEDGFRFTGISFFDNLSSASAPFPNGCGIGLRRTVLHALLLARAQELGVTFRWGVKNVDFENLTTSVVVGADGQNSSLRRWAGLEAIRGDDRRYGFRRHFKTAPWSSQVELYWGRSRQIYVTPVASDEVCVALISREKTLRLAQALDETPQLKSRLAGCSAITPELGSVSASRHLLRVFKGNILLIGDASGSVDAITGQGMCLSFRQALALADAVKSGHLNDYSREHARIRRLPAFMSALMLTLDRYPALQTRTLAALASCPEAFGSLVGVHVGEPLFASLCNWQLLNLGAALMKPS